MRSAAAVLNDILVAASWHPRLSVERPNFKKTERDWLAQPVWRKSLNFQVPNGVARMRRKRHRHARRRNRRVNPS